MGFFMVLRRINFQKAYLPKISIPGQIFFLILAQLSSDDNRVKFRRICTESSEQNRTSIFETIFPTMLVSGK